VNISLFVGMYRAAQAVTIANLEAWLFLHWDLLMHPLHPVGLVAIVAFAVADSVAALWLSFVREVKAVVLAKEVVVLGVGVVVTVAVAAAFVTVESVVAGAPVVEVAVAVNGVF